MPAFDPPLRFARPLLPDFSSVCEKLSSGWKEGSVTKGALTVEYEKKLSSILGVPHALAVSSCTSGLVMALQALNLKGDVLVPSFTFTSTAQALLWNNLTPVFVDCHPAKLTVRVEALESSLTSRTVAAVVPYIFGNPPPLDEIEEFCRAKKLALLLDAAHAFGTLYHGKPAGGRGNAEVFSTSATKLLCTGEGGVVSTRMNELAGAVELIREYGHDSGYEVKHQGLNGRMTELQAAMGIEGLLLLDEHALRRNRLASAYRVALKSLPVSFQEIEPDCRSSYKDFAMLLEEGWRISRDKVAEALDREGIPTRKYFAPLHLQSYFAARTRGETRLPVTEKIWERILCLPIFYDLKENEIERIADVLSAIFQSGGLPVRANR